MSHRNMATSSLLSLLDVPGIDAEQAKESVKEMASDSADLLNSLFRIAMVAGTSSQYVRLKDELESTH